MRQRHRREDMERLLAQRTEQGLTFRQLSEQSGVPVPTLSCWASKLRRERSEEQPSLVPVELVDEGTREPISIETRGGLRVIVEPGFDAGHLSRLLSVLAASC